jgi:hypothetical protein
MREKQFRNATNSTGTAMMCVQGFGARRDAVDYIEDDSSDNKRRENILVHTN